MFSFGYSKKKEHKLDENVLRIKEIQKHMNRGRKI